SEMPPTIQMKPGPPPPFASEKTVSPAKTVTPVEATDLMKGAPPPPVAARARPKPPAVAAPARPNADEEAPVTVVLASPEPARGRYRDRRQPAPGRHAAGGAGPGARSPRGEGGAQGLHAGDPGRRAGDGDTPRGAEADARPRGPGAGGRRHPLHPSGGNGE